jgi:ubiquinone biosynthesis protein COQ4
MAEQPTWRMDWGRAWRALRDLVADPERTDLAFEIVSALSAGSMERTFARVSGCDAGRALLGEKPDLLAALSDRERLRALPDGSFGREYARFMDAAGLSPEGLVEADAEATRNDPDARRLDPEREWLGHRMREAHDLWHVLTGYGRDEAGEAANLAFSFGQITNPGLALMVLAGAVLGPWDPTFAWQRYLLAAFLRGWSASDLALARYEELLPLPLSEVRRRLAITPPEVAHPDGIVVAKQATGRPLGGPAPANHAA